MILYNRSNKHIFIGIFYDDEHGGTERKDYCVAPNNGIDSTLICLTVEGATKADKAVDEAWERNR